MKLEYKTLSRFYDGIILDKQYENWLNFLASTLKKQNPGPHGIDFACGTGLFTRKLKAEGFEVVGVDISPDMLAVAEEKTRAQKLNIKYYLGDYKTFKLKEKQAFITAVNDGFNYVDRKGLKKAFSNVYQNLLKGGVFMFDISTEYKLKNVLGCNMYGDDSEELSYLWFNDYHEETKSLDMTLTFFKRNGDFYQRSTEVQSQFAHDDCVEDLLISAGFKILSKTDENGNELTKNSQKILFIAQK